MAETQNASRLPVFMTRAHRRTPSFQGSPRPRPTQSQSKRGSRFLTTVLPFSAAILAGALSYLSLTSGGRDVRMQASLGPIFNRALVFSGFGIDQVSVTGQTYTADRDIYDAIDLAHVTNFLELDTQSVRARIERLPWVETADLMRVFPGELIVRITERVPFALWRRGDRDFLIDRTGRTLAPVKRDAKLALPLVDGEGADQEASSIVTLLGRFPDISKRLVRAEWVSGRRWTLHLKDGVAINLPSDSEALALEAIAKEGSLGALITGSNHVIDLRAAGRVTVRSQGRIQAGGAS